LMWSCCQSSRRLSAVVSRSWRDDSGPAVWTRVLGSSPSKREETDPTAGVVHARSPSCHQGTCEQVVSVSSDGCVCMLKSLQSR
jgi:hypothetical protein